MTGFWAKFLAVFGHKLRFISEHFVLIGLNAARRHARVIQMAFNTHTRLRSQSVFNTPVCFLIIPYWLVSALVRLLVQVPSSTSGARRAGVSPC